MTRLRHILAPWRTAGLLATALLPALAAPPPRTDLTPDALRQAYTRAPAEWPAPWIDAGVPFVELAPAPRPPTPTARERREATLGARLFADRRLSADARVACADCHQPGHGWSVPTPVASGLGGQPGRRHPPGLHTVAARRLLDWDGRSRSLTARSLAPLTDPREMGNATLGEVLARVQAEPDHAAALRALDGRAALTPQRLGELLAAFQRGLDRPTRFDRFLRGEHEQLGPLELRGLHLFRTKARCVNCHFGPLLSDEQFHNLGISFFGEPSQDLGRHDITGRCEDVGRFRTASLRHVARRPPYMHNGLFRTLRGVIHLYQRGGGEIRARNAAEAAHPLFPCAATLSPRLQPLPLDPGEVEALLAFLRAL